MDKQLTTTDQKSSLDTKAAASFIDYFIKAETNLERLPFFAPWTKSRSKKIKHTLVRKVKRADTEIEISWTVSANPEYGYPNAFDLDVYRAVQQVIHDYYRDNIPENGVIAFSFRQVEQRMCQGHSGRLKKDIRTSLERLVATTIKSKGMFFYKGTRQYVDDTFHIFDRVTFVGQTVPGGGVAETNFLELSRWYRDSLKSWYVMPLDNNFHFSLRSANAKSLYGILSFYFYARPEGQDWVRRKYSELCEETIITKHPYFSTGFRKLQPALNELIEKKFLSKVESQPLQEQTKGDGWIYFWPGERVLHPERFLLSDAQPMLWDEVDSSKNNVLPASSSNTTNDTAVSLIGSFYSKLSGRSSSKRKISRAEQELVETWINAHGQSCFEEFTEYALEQKRTRWPEMASLTGALNAYGDEFIKFYEQQKEERARRETAEKEYQIIEELRPRYRLYFQERLRSVQENFPEQYSLFEKTLQENNQYKQLQKSVAEGNDHWQRSVETIEENIAYHFFSPNTNANLECHVLDFVDWRVQFEKK